MTTMIKRLHEGAELTIDDKLDILIHGLVDIHTRLVMLEEALYEPDFEERGGSEEPPLMH